MKRKFEKTSFKVGDLIKLRFCPNSVGIIVNTLAEYGYAKYKIRWISGNSWLTHLMKSQMVKLS